VLQRPVGTRTGASLDRRPDDRLAVTEQERIDRETLLKRAAAAAGAVYVAPVLTASAVGAEPCSGQPCTRDRDCQQQSGSACRCVDGRCKPSCLCQFAYPPCGFEYPERCDWTNKNYYGCACMHAAARDQPLRCIYIENGLCTTFEEKHGTCPGGSDAECPAGKVCFSSCCDLKHGFPPLCALCCGDWRRGGAQFQPETGDGPMLWLRPTPAR
jgi:hypothetical protein